jgi:hypothetical protein
VDPQGQHGQVDQRGGGPGRAGARGEVGRFPGARAVATAGTVEQMRNGSRGYIEYYGKLREAALTDQGLFDAMVSRYPGWVSRQQSLILG